MGFGGRVRRLCGGGNRDNLLFRLTEDDWDTVMAVNLRGPFLMSRAVQKYMTAAKWGRIVNISSVLGRFGVAGYTAYCASKHGVIGFTRALALELAPRRVTVNALEGGREAMLSGESASRAPRPSELDRTDT